MKLVVATPLYPPEIGGPATYAKTLEEGLPERGIDVTLVKFSEVRHLPKLVRHVAYCWHVLRAARSADAVLALDPVSTGFPACLAARLAKKPFVVKVVGDYAWEQGQQRFGITASLDEFVKTKRVPLGVSLLRRVQTGVARRANKVLVPSEYLKGIVAAWGIPKEKIEVTYNAVPVDELGTVPDAVQKLSRPLVVTAGRLVPWKNIDGVIDATALVLGASLVVVGDGPDREMLSKRAAEKLPGRALFTGQLSHEDTLAVVASADVFVLNSSYEGLSHLLIEALSLGCAIVATEAGGNPEVVADGVDGLLVPVGDTSALANAIAQLLSDGDMQARCKAHAKESSKRFSQATMLDRTAAFFKAL